jgi:Ca-activated chloride channel homolog
MLRRISLLVAGTLTLAAPLAAQGWIEPDPRMRILNQVQKLRSTVDIAVQGRVARVTVEEWFRNTGGGIAEGVYIYPLAGEAVFSDFSLWMGDQELRGEMMNAEQARAIYEAIVRRQKDPALIELAGSGMLRARVFPIQAGETRKIALRYTLVLDREGDALRVRYAGAPANQLWGPPAGEQVRPWTTAPTRLRVTADSGARFGEPYSPTHALTTARRDGRLEIALADTILSGQLEIFLPEERRTVGMTVVTHRPAGEDGYFMLLLSPASAEQARNRIQRDVVAVLDVSGSMSGDKMDQARGALVQLLSTLRAPDRFRLISFSTSVNRYRTEWTVATDDERRRATEWVQQLTASGGTNIAGALREAFAQAPDEGALSLVVFMTDGLPTVGEASPERIADQAQRDRGGFRVFSFGVGYDVNTFLLDRLAEGGRGATAYVQPGENIERAVGTLTAKIQSPVLTDLRIANAPVELTEVYPGELPDLFHGQDVVVFGRFRGATSGNLAITGRRGGREERFTTTAEFGAEGGGEYVAKLWASRKAAALTREIRLRGGNPEVIEELRRLALRYGILTEYTAYLVQEPGIAMNQMRGEMERRVMEAPAPASQSGQGAVGRAQASARLDASTVTAADAAQVGVARGYVANPVATRRAGARVFGLRDSVWTDIAHDRNFRVVKVAPFSDAYFALVRSLPEIRPALAVDTRVLVAGKGVSVQIDSAGKTAWTAGELDALVRDFRS